MQEDITLFHQDALEYLPKGVGVCTGSPIRPELFDGNAERAHARYGFDSKPVILSMGGSLGSVILNKALRENLPELTKKYNIIHLCGKGNIDEAYSGVMFLYSDSKELNLSIKESIAFTPALLNSFLNLLNFLINSGLFSSSCLIFSAQTPI